MGKFRRRRIRAMPIRSWRFVLSPWLLPCATSREVSGPIRCDFITFFNSPHPSSLVYHNSVVLVREQYRPSDSRLSVKLAPNLADRGVSRSQRDGAPTAGPASLGPGIYSASNKKWVPKNISGNKARPARKGDISLPSVCPVSRKCGILDVWTMDLHSVVMT
jgi:hypothetical protein